MTIMDNKLALSATAVERAIDEFRRQRGITIGEIAYYPAEFIGENPGLRPSFLLVSAPRAEALGLPPQPARIDVAGMTAAEITKLANPLARQTLSAIKTAPASEADSLALALAKYASLLPALVVTGKQDWLTVKATDIKHYIAAPLTGVTETAQARLPLEGMEDVRIISFRSRHGASVHLALVMGRPGDAPLVRIHSSCVTGDILGSLRCDCGDQLKLAMDAIRREGGGVLVYLHQEGRGIGITNKLRAYALQERGMDTYEANRQLGFEEDERDFSIAAAILKKLGIRRIRMLTNNPHKLEALKAAGVEVAERVPLVAPSGKHNHGYLDAKGKKAGHLF
ncbi:MAG: GTP cyclohydrolase II [Pseudomonadota bacterium]|nr:GTP cyclohydrolase II [Pseudomonadota bacterium]